MLALFPDAMKNQIRAIIKQFGPDGDPVLKWIGFAVVFLFIIPLGVVISAIAKAIADAISAAATAIANVFAPYLILDVLSVLALAVAGLALWRIARQSRPN